MPLTPVPEDTSAPTLRRVFHKEPDAHHSEDAVTFDHAGQRYELVMGEDTFTIARHTPGIEDEPPQTFELPRDAASIFVHPEVQELLCK